MSRNRSAGQALSGDGRCIPTAILAQTKKRLIPTTREASANSPRPKAWETTVLAMAPLPIQPQATRQAEPALAARSEAPAGRMALAGPKLELVQPAAPAAEAPNTVLQRIEANPPTTSAPAKGSTAAAAKAPRLAAVLPLADETVNRTPPPITQAPPRADPPVRNTAVSRQASPSAPPRPRVVYAPYNGPAFVAQARTSFNASIFVKLAREGR